MNLALRISTLCMVLLCAQAQLWGQCDTGSEPECECETAEILCSINELDGYSFSMSDFQHPEDGPDPLCGGSWVPNNPTWFAFIAWCDELTLTVEISNCTTVGGTTGAQVGVYSDCSSFTEVDCIGNDCNNEDDKVLELDNLTIGATYYFMIDGCLGSACDVVIDVDGMCTEEIEDWTNEEIFGDQSVCQGDEIDYTVDDLDGAVNYHWSVDGSEIDVTSDPENSIVWNTEGTYTLCVDVSNDCVDIDDDPVEICETITVSDPDAGTIDAVPNPLCPGEFSDVEVTGYNDDPAYEQVLIIVDDSGEVIDVITNGTTTSVTLDECGTLTVYSLNYPTTEMLTIPSIGGSYSGSDCEANCCDEVFEEIRFEDEEDPTFDSEPADITVDCYADVPPSVDLTAMDNCTADAIITANETDDSDMCDGGTITREWTFSDDCGNMVTHTQTITIEPIPEPDYLNPPSDLVLNCDDPIPPAMNLDYTNGGVGMCLIEGSVVPVTNGMFDICGSIITYEWDFTDMCGNNINHVQTIEIEPAEEPFFENPPGDLILTCEDPIPTPENLDYTNGDTAPCLIEGSVAPVTNGTFDACGSVITNTWEYTDACNNTIEHVQTIEIEPSERAAYIDPPADITLECDAYLSYTIEDLEYTNNSSGACEIAGFISPVVMEDINECGGVTEVQYSFTDDCGRDLEYSQNITINPPLQTEFIGAPVDITVSCANIPPPASALSHTNGESGLCLIDGLEDPVIDEDYDACGGTITNTWEYEDDCGRVTEHVQVITIDPAPEAEFQSFPADMTMDCSEFDLFTPATLFYTNNQMGTCLIEGNLDPEENGEITECGGVIEYIWEFEDDCNRVIQHIQEITVNPAPEAQFVNIPSDVTVDCEEVNEDPLFIEYNNFEDGVCEIQGFVQAIPNGTIDACGGTIVMEWEFTDNCGRTITASQNVEFLPAPEPEFDELPEDMTIECDEDLPDADPLFYDNGEDEPCEISGEVDPIVDFDDNIYTYTWTFTNPCSGFTIEHVQTLEKLIPVEFDEDEYEFEICVGNMFDLSELSLNDINNTDPEISYHDDLPPDSGNEIDPEITLEEDYAEFYIVGTNEYGCFDVVTVYFFADEPVSAGEDIEEEYCIGTELLDMFSFLEPPASLDGEFTQISGPSDLDVDFGDEVDVSEAEPGVYEFEYFVQSGNSCPDDESLMTIELLEEPQIELISIECSENGDFYEVIVSNNNYDFEISGGQITNETQSSVTISDIPIDINLIINLESSGDCINSYTFNSPDCACPMVEAPVSNGDVSICLGDAIPSLSVVESNEYLVNWYDAPVGGNLLQSNSFVYTPAVSLPGSYSFYAESESLTAAGCYGPFRTEVTITIQELPATIDTTVVFCNESNSALYVYNRSELEQLINPSGASVTIEYFLSLNDLNNQMNAQALPLNITAPGNTTIYALLENTAMCSSMSTINFNINPLPELEVTVTDENCFGAEDGTANINFNSSSTNNTLSLNGNIINELALSDLAPGAYEFILADSLQCTDTVVVNIAEGLALSIEDYTINCFDNGTNSDGSDDFYEIQFVVNSSFGNTGDFSLDYGQGITSFNYGDIVDISYPADNSILEFNILDNINGCSLQFESDVLFSCSTDCALSTDNLSYECNDNGTPLNPDDDFYIVNITVTAVNPGASGSYNIVSNGTVIANYTYGEEAEFNLDADGSISDLIAQDADIQSCQISLEGFSLEPCSFDCLITADEISSICSDNGTQQVEEDDFYTFNYIITGENTSDSFLIVEYNMGFAYGEVIVFDSIAVEDGPVILTLVDQINPNCELELILNPESPCSDPCTIEVTDLSISNCIDNGTANDISDDYYDISFIINNIEGPMSMISISDDRGNTYGPYNYNELIQLTQLIADGIDYTFTVVDMAFNNCLTSFVTNQGPCSNGCAIELNITDITCDNNMTELDNGDDIYDVSILVNATGGSNGFFTDQNDAGIYGDLLTFSDLNISDGNWQLIVQDSIYSDCSATINIIAPPACSQPCTLEFVEFEIEECDDNSTNADMTDDFFSIIFTLEVTDGVFGNPVVENQDGDILGTFDYNTSIELGPFPADGSNIVLFFSDDINTSCALDTSFMVEPCSEACIIEATIVNTSCNDNGSPESNDDDLFNVTLLVEGINTAQTFTIDNTTQGMYNQEVTLTDFLISGGAISLSIVDDEDASCIQEVQILPPEPCSSPCSLELTELTIGECDDNGTGSLASDDFFDITFIITDAEGGGTEYFLTSSGESYGPFAYNTLESISSLAANGMDFILELEDSSNDVCALSLNISQSPCSECSNTVSIEAIETELNCETDMLELSLNSDGNITEVSWSGPDSFSSDASTINVSIEGLYTVTVTFDDGCISSDDVVISQTLITPFSSAVTSDIINCENNSVTIDGTASILTNNTIIEWSTPNGTISDTDLSLEVFEAGAYSLILTDTVSLCSSISPTVNVIEYFNVPTLVIYANPSFIFDCEITSIELSTDPQANTLYTWIIENEIISNELSIEVTNPSLVSLIALDTVSFCSDEDLVNLEDFTEYPIIELNGLTELNCDFDEICVEANIISVGTNTQYIWYDQNGEILLENELVYCTNSAESFYFEVTDIDNNCINSASFEIEAPIEVELELPSIIDLTVGQNYTLNPTINLSSNQIASIIWESDSELSCYDCLSPSILEYANEDEIVLTVVSISGCETTVSTRIRVEEIIIPEVYIPNVFSPSRGDKFTMYASEDIEIIDDFYIYDRWGELVYSNSNFSPNEPDLGWDGYFNNNKAEQGVYVYLFIFEINGRTERRYGDVTLLW